MELKWYWLAETLGLSENLTEPGSREISYRVSAQADEFFTPFFLSLEIAAVVGLFLIGYVIRRHACKTGNVDGGRLCITVGVVILCFIGLFQAVGLGPYIEWYPGQHSSGFIDLSFIDHCITGIYCAILALMLHLGGRLGRRHAIRQYNYANSSNQEEPS